AAMLPGSSAALPGELARLPFVQVTVDGLALHDAIRVPVAAALEGVDPSRYAGYRQAAWQVVDRELRAARAPDVWRYTADLLYLIDHPLVREAFFPPSALQQVVEAASVADVDDITRIAHDHLVPTIARTVAGAVTAAPDRVRVVRSTTDPVAGFMLRLGRGAFTSDPISRDPLVGAVREHLRRHPVPPSQDVLVLLATLSRAAGEARSDASAALWLDIKRTYLDRRDRLRRVYAIVVDAQAFLETARPLGFTAVGDPVEVDGVVHHVTLLDFGPSCVDGWLSWLAGEQVGHPPSALRLEPATRTARLRERDVTLSQLEFGLLDLLVRRGGRPVSRSDLIREVWGHDHAGGSNVVDAVVRTLRRKLGPAGEVVEAVRGVGYRYAADTLDDRTVL
ncbi:MAG TPA: winged helix-turn-helix domain-containing protein, partial [Euzebyales bacterium]|nr:winged helix-turn-helix domain-containing protein [Euzebyales bacterium]